MRVAIEYRMASGAVHVETDHGFPGDITAEEAHAVIAGKLLEEDADGNPVSIISIKTDTGPALLMARHIESVTVKVTDPPPWRGGLRAVPADTSVRTYVPQDPRTLGEWG